MPPRREPAASSAATSRISLPTQVGWSGQLAIMIRPRASKDFSTIARNRGNLSGSLRGSITASVPPSRSLSGRSIAVIVVLLASYGYWSTVTRRTFGTRLFDQCCCGTDFSPIRVFARLEVGDVNGQAAAATDFDGLFNRLDQLISLVTDVARVDPAPLTDDLRNRPKFLDVGEGSGNILQPG